MGLPLWQTKPLMGLIPHSGTVFLFIKKLFQIYILANALLPNPIGGFNVTNQLDVGACNAWPLKRFNVL